MEVDGGFSRPSESRFGNGYFDFFRDGSSRDDLSRLLRGSLAPGLQSSAGDVYRPVQRCLAGLKNGRSTGGAVHDLAFIGLTLIMFLVMIGYVRFCARMN